MHPAIAPSAGRFAIYYAPPRHSTLERFGSAWLGRDTATGELIQQLPVAGLDPAWVTVITATPRHYGFHATLKPPFVLAEGNTPEQLHARLLEFAATQRAFMLPRLQLQAIDGFLALYPTGDCPALDTLAAACVTDHDAFRAPPTAAELRQRRRAALTARQLELLERWGYPYVLDAFRFHMTLTSRLRQAELETVLAALRPLLEPLFEEPLWMDEICLFAQETRETPFRLIRRYGFADGLGAAG